ncbi:MAG: hypothetical protein K2G52_13360 [Muribaculaceae bacterium]|nr:hypothetical protein [Muribaculaceae bacterium]
MDFPKLRDSSRMNQSLHSLSSLPNDSIYKIGAAIIYMVCTGRKDITGDDWGDIFADSINGKHLASPVGIADVVKDNIGWSLKTVKVRDPFNCKQIRLISGRCSPDFSYGITDPHEDVQKTGEAVIAIWNSRVDIAMSHYHPCRTAVLIRDEELKKFCFFEEYLEHYNISEFRWEENPRGNLEGFEIKSGIKRFVWQPHGAQLTVITRLPRIKQCFQLHSPGVVDKEKFLESIGYTPEWVEIIH